MWTLFLLLTLDVPLLVRTGAERSGVLGSAHRFQEWHQEEVNLTPYIVDGSGATGAMWLKRGPLSPRERDVLPPWISSLCSSTKQFLSLLQCVVNEAIFSEQYLTLTEDLGIIDPQTGQFCGLSAELTQQGR